MTEKYGYNEVYHYVCDNENQIDLSVREASDIMNELYEENKQLKFENKTYQNIFFEIVETALTDKNCRELYCKGILDIFNKANSLNQAREMIKEYLK